MLSNLFGDLSNEDHNPMLEDAYRVLKKSALLLQEEMNRYKDPSHDLRKIEIWTRGLSSALTELEQSYAVAMLFRKSIIAGFMDDMTGNEQVAYARYVYFYKNGFIRVFAILDKLGTVLNEVYNLQTSKVKSQYSYFTVLRQFSYHQKHNSLGSSLRTIKDEYREALQILRKRRNAEIHYMNTEMQDDLWQRHQGLNDKIVLEDLDLHLKELKQGLDMVCKTLSTTFLYTNKHWIGN